MLAFHALSKTPRSVCVFYIRIDFMIEYFNINFFVVFIFCYIRILTDENFFFRMSTGEPSKLSAQFVKKKEQQQSFSDGEESPRSPPIGVSVTRLPSKERLMHGHVSSYDAADGNDTVNNAKQSSYRHDLMHVISTPLDKVAMPHGHLNNAMPGKASVPHIPQYSPASACDYNFNWARSGSSQLLPSGDMSMAYDKSVKSNTDGLSYDNISSIS